eukprot:1183483-Prorocentrum_minimum.AAC.1
MIKRYQSSICITRVSLASIDSEMISRRDIPYATTSRHGVQSIAGGAVCHEKFEFPKVGRYASPPSTCPSAQ